MLRNKCVFKHDYEIIVINFVPLCLPVFLFREVRGGWMRAPAACTWRSDLLEIHAAGVSGENFTSSERGSSRRDISPKQETLWRLWRRRGHWKPSQIWAHIFCTHQEERKKFCDGGFSNGRRLSRTSLLVSDVWGNLLICYFTTLEDKVDFGLCGVVDSMQNWITMSSMTAWSHSVTETRS